MLLKVLLPLIAISLTLAGEDGTYDYKDPDNVWTGICKTGSSQSPIDVITPSGNENSATWSSKKYTFSLQDNVNASFVFKSHTVFYEIAQNQEILVADPTKEDTAAKILQLHFHWGDNHTLGAEHHIDGVSHSAEIHLVTQRKDGSLVVFNRFLQEGHGDNSEIGRLLKEENIEDLDLSDLYPSSIKVILTYQGSLTTPPCSEVVTWVIVPEPLKISTVQAKVLRAWTYDGKRIGDTHRPIQLLNGRTMYGITLISDDTNETEDEDSSDAVECSGGQEKIISSAGTKTCKDCERGEFGWKGKCNQCPPGKSTVGTGSEYSDCLDNRYITCSIENEIYKCGLNHCPCDYSYEECSDGACVKLNNTLAAVSSGETPATSMLLVLTVLTLLLQLYSL